MKSNILYKKNVTEKEKELAYKVASGFLEDNNIKKQIGNIDMDSFNHLMQFER